MKDYPLPVQALWFLLVGWWATPVVVNLATFFFITIVGIPVGIVLINNVPTVLMLKSKRDLGADGQPDQHSLPLRAVYFVFVGWWLGFLWGNLASLFAITIIGLPITIWMLNRLPYVVSLYRY